MKAHTSEFKENIKVFGRELDSKITYTISGTTTELGNEQLNSVTPHYEGAILKSVMKQLDIDSNVEIPVGTLLNYKFGVKTRSGKNLFDETNMYNGYYYPSDFTLELDNSYRTVIINNLKAGTYTFSTTLTNCYLLRYAINNTNINLNTSSNTYTFTTPTDGNFMLCFRKNPTSTISETFTTQLEQGTQATEYEKFGAYDYINYGNYIVKEVKKKEDTSSYEITCYDKMLYSMTNYVSLNITYPITIRNYINTICTHLGLTFANASSTFANYDKQLTRELYLSYNEETQAYSSLGYKFRDVLDELAEVTASTICINDDDELEVRYINQTVDKNLWDNQNYYTQLTTANYTIQNNGFLFNRGSLTGSRYIAKKIAVENGKTYTFSAVSSSWDSNFYLVIYRGNVYGTNLASSTNGVVTYTATANEELFFTFIISSRKQTATVSNIQVEQNNAKTTFEPYGDTIDEEYLKDVNVNFGEKFGPVNTIVLSRSAESDNVYYPSTLPANPIEIKITDNQIMNDNNRATYMPDIYAKLNGLEYYINDFSSTGVCYYDLCDKYNIKVGDKFYSCIMFNDEVNITQGLKEEIYTDMPEDTNTEYSKADATDRKINGAYIMADKANARIDAVTRQYDNVNGRLNKVEDIQTATSKQINVISQNVTYEYDPDTGEPISSKINSVETIKGFTFDENGLTITNNQTDYKSVQDETGTYYYDGNTITGEYTKDGSKQKDLYLFGVYYYGMKERTDTPMFVAQLYTDNNNEECFGHFYNRGD